MTAQRLDAWGRLVTPQDSTMGKWFDARHGCDDHCDLCGRPTPSDPDITDVTGMTVCTHCIEASL